VHLECCACTFFKNTNQPITGAGNQWMVEEDFLVTTEWQVKVCWFSVWREWYFISFNGKYRVIAQIFLKIFVILNWKL